MNHAAMKTNGVKILTNKISTTFSNMTFGMKYNTFQLRRYMDDVDVMMRKRSNKCDSYSVNCLLISVLSTGLLDPCTKKIM